jgi:hypothetical protein
MRKRMERRKKKRRKREAMEAPHKDRDPLMHNKALLNNSSNSLLRHRDTHSSNVLNKGLPPNMRQLLIPIGDKNRLHLGIRA